MVGIYRKQRFTMTCYFFKLRVRLRRELFYYSLILNIVEFFLPKYTKINEKVWYLKGPIKHLKKFKTCEMRK